MCSEIVGWVRYSAAAALEKEPSSTTLTKISSCLRSTLGSIGGGPAAVPTRRARKIQRAPKGPVLTARRAMTPLMAPAAAAPAARAAGCRNAALGASAGPHAHERQPAHDARARARRAGHGGLPGHELLELGAAVPAAVLVDRHRAPSASARLLAAALDVALDEFLGVFLEDVVDLVEQAIQLFLDLLALLAQVGAARAAILSLGGLGGLRLLLLLLCHARSPPGPMPGASARSRPSGGRSPADPGTSPAGPRTTSGK